MKRLLYIVLCNIASLCMFSCNEISQNSSIFNSESNGEPEKPFPDYYYRNYSYDFIEVLKNSDSKELEIINFKKNKYIARGGVVFESGDYAIYRAVFDFNNNEWFDDNCNYTIDYYNSDDILTNYYTVTRKNNELMVNPYNMYGDEHVIDQFEDIMLHHFYELCAKNENQDWFDNPTIECLYERLCFKYSFDWIDIYNHTFYIDQQYDITLQYINVSSSELFVSELSDFVNLFDSELPHFLDIKDL